MTETKIGALSRGDFLRVSGVFLASVALSACGVKTSQEAPVGVEPTAVDRNGSLPLIKGETATLGKLNIINQSEKMEMCIVPTNLREDFAKAAGLENADSNPATIVFSDIDDADPSTSQLEGASTSYDPRTGSRRGDIAINFFLKLANDQKSLPNTPLNTEERFNNYLSVIISQATLVEISNQCNVGTINTDDPSQLESLDRTSNALGKSYVDEIIAGKAQPFIVVTSVKK